MSELETCAICGSEVDDEFQSFCSNCTCIQHVEHPDYCFFTGLVIGHEAQSKKDWNIRQKLIKAESKCAILEKVLKEKEAEMCTSLIGQEHVFGGKIKILENELKRFEMANENLKQMVKKVYDNYRESHHKCPYCSRSCMEHRYFCSLGKILKEME